MCGIREVLRVQMFEVRPRRTFSRWGAIDIEPAQIADRAVAPLWIRDTNDLTQMRRARGEVYRPVRDAAVLLESSVQCRGTSAGKAAFPVENTQTFQPQTRSALDVQGSHARVEITWVSVGNARHALR